MNKETKQIYTKILSEQNIPNIAYIWNDGQKSSSYRPSITVNENQFVEVLNQLYLDGKFHKAIIWLGEYLHFFKSRYCSDFNNRKLTYNLNGNLPVNLSQEILKTIKSHKSKVDIMKVLHSNNPRDSIKRYAK